jgi:glutamate/tyrosine decarboxylase-like PLP-dependent enzyme
LPHSGRAPRPSVLKDSQIMTEKSAKSLQQTMFEEFQNKTVFKQAQKFAFDYADKAFDRNVFPDSKAIKNLQLFDEPMPDNGALAGQVIQQLHEHGSPASMSQIGGRYFGLVNGGVIPTSLAAKWLSDFWDQNTPLYLSSPIASQLESVVENWLKSLLGLPAETVAGFVSGSSMAIFCCLAAARYRIYQHYDWDVNAKGLANAPPIRIIAGRHAHATVIKAISLLGLGYENIEWIECDEQGRIETQNLPKFDQSCLLILQAGNVNSGSFDDFGKICKVARQAGAWSHIDGAFGLWAAASQSLKHLTNGMEMADSWSVDAHKTLNAPYDNGISLCRDRDALVNALHASGAYFTYGDKRDGMLYTPEMSRRARVVELWAALKYLGQSGVDELVTSLHQNARHFATRLTEAGFEISNEVVFNQILVDCGPSVSQPSMLEHIQQSGECWVGGTIWLGQPRIRVSVCSWATTEADIDRSVAAFVAARSASKI